METLLKKNSFVATRNACKMCAPLGASLAFKGIEGCVPLIHGSQGCATYVRRYLISHFKEPMDIASSNFTEESTIFGGGQNLKRALDNIKKQYHPKVVGISTTCLSETIGDDVDGALQDYARECGESDKTTYIHAQTPSYQGSHADGFHEAVAAAVKRYAVKGESNDKTVLLAGFMSPGDLRYLKEVMREFRMSYVLLPDYSETMDNPHWDEYKLLPEGGTKIADIADAGSAKTFIQFGEVLNKGRLSGRVSGDHSVTSAGDILEKQFDIPGFRIPFPIGIKNSDTYFETLRQISGNDIPEEIAKERGRLIDAYVDGHKYLFGKKAMIYGEEDFVIALTAFLTEIGIDPVIIASGGESKLFEKRVRENKGTENSLVLTGGDFETMAERAREIKPDIIIGHSKGYYIARELSIPIVRIGFPVHDRVGGQRILHLGYKGTHNLFDLITNAIIEYKQDNSPVGYKYM
ncbi:nitrogenase component 1 [Saccharicrinis sp. FJH62]|uniref:nitrogenase component 1 n=1 Tax=Saccharicrinis sp. FJH62 TaxID=3344657 RepID=UPI0035D4FB38